MLVFIIFWPPKETEKKKTSSASYMHTINTLEITITDIFIYTHK